MKVALLNNLYAPYFLGGAEKSVESLVDGLVAAGVEVSVITLHEGAEVEHDSRGSIDIWRLPLKNIHWPFGLVQKSAVKRLIWHLVDTYNIAASKELRRVLSKIKPDVLHTNNMSGFSVSAWAAAKSLGIPIVHTARDYHLLHPNSTLFAAGRQQDPDGLAARLWSFVKLRNSRLVDGFIPISNYVREIHLERGYFSNATVDVIYNSVSSAPPWYSRKRRSRNKLVLGFLGRLDSSKGLDLVVKSARANPHHEWIVAGEGRASYYQSLLHESPGNVKYIGKVSPAELFSQVDFLVAPSEWAEPLGRVAIEAFVHGVPVIASRIGGLKDLVEDGLTGFLFQPGNVDDLTKCIERASDFDELIMKEACLSKASNFSPAYVAARYVQVYERSCAHKSGPSSDDVKRVNA